MCFNKLRGSPAGATRTPPPPCVFIINLSIKEILEDQASQLRMCVCWRVVESPKGFYAWRCGVYLFSCNLFVYGRAFPCFNQRNKHCKIMVGSSFQKKKSNRNRSSDMPYLNVIYKIQPTLNSFWQECISRYLTHKAGISTINVCWCCLPTTLHIRWYCESCSLNQLSASFHHLW